MSDLRIQFGCGGIILDGFQNHDAECPIEKPLPYGNNVAAFVYCSHCMEHVHVHDALHFLRECHRILKAGGTVRLVVPTLKLVTDRAHGCDLILGHGHQHLWSETSLHDILWAAGFPRNMIYSASKTDIDRHSEVIGKEKDELESCYVEAVKV